MPQNRFYIDHDLKPNTTVTLENDEHHHLKDVMRVKEQDMIELVNGKGFLAKGLVKSIEKKQTVIFLQETSFSDDPKKVTLVLSLTKFSKLDLAIEKCTELGVYRFILFDSINSEKKGLSKEQSKRLKAITIAAMKQCGRLYLPDIIYTEQIKELLPFHSPAFVCDFEQNAQSIRSILDMKDVTLIIGPEKGFHKTERALFKTQNIKTISLHQNILRAETAAIAAAAYLTLF